ncbi:PREDICTED: gap junction delta-2 protein-like [Cyprinodon variegatus]|uniref:gap junction delta-2 protein-like n=1 Tax=Cyprinodon variegatus TaxID=28743 RepID=UPI000742CB4E|nr:PREDICTED: gap junction delta-2 protein-like [Cyprinodon variegatus]
MTEWTLLKRLLDAVHHHSTMIGRLWLTVMVIFRLLIVAVATEDLYTDEQEMFVCNTLQPGCSTVCYDTFAPISQPRFWVFHIISVSTPSLCFIIYTWHNLSKQSQNSSQKLGKGQRHGRPAGEQAEGKEDFDCSCDSDSCSIQSHKHLGHSLADVLKDLVPPNLQKKDLVNIVPLKQAQAGSYKEGSVLVQVASCGVLSKCYIFHVCIRTILEIGFVLAQWKLYGFQVPVQFLCTSSPCSQPVDCYVSRPTEKTIFLLFMFCVGVFCIVLNFLELNHLGWKKIRQSLKLRENKSCSSCPGIQSGYKPFPLDSPSLTPSFGFREVASSSSLPTVECVEGQQPEWRCALNFKDVEVEVRPGQAKKTNSQRAERSKRESGMCKQRNAEVWI